MNHISQLLHFIAARCEAVFHHDPVTNTYTVHENDTLPAVARISPEVVAALHRDGVIVPMGEAVSQSTIDTLHQSLLAQFPSSPATQYGMIPPKTKPYHQHFTSPTYRPSTRRSEDLLTSAVVGVATGYALSSLFDSDDHSSHISSCSSSSEDSSSSFSSGGGDFSGGGSSSSWDSSSSSSDSSSSSSYDSGSSSSYDSGSSSSDCGSSGGSDF